MFLTGPWPDTITLNALTGDSTVIIIVNENGQQTTINADGTVTNGNANPNVNPNPNDNPNQGGNQSQGGNTGGGTDNPGDGSIIDGTDEG